MGSTQEIDFVVALAQEITLSVAPEEAGVFDLQAEAYRANPDLSSETPRDDPLGSAFGTIAPLVTPLAFELGKKVWEKLTDKTIDGALAQGGKVLRGRLGRRPKPSKPQVPTAEKLDELHQEIILWTSGLNWTPEQQSRAADATISTMARMRLSDAREEPDQKP